MAEKYPGLTLRRFTFPSPFQKWSSKKYTKDRRLNHSVVEMFDWFDAVNADYSIVDFGELPKTIDQRNYRECMSLNGTPKECSENFNEVIKEFFAGSNISDRKAYPENLMRPTLDSSEILSGEDFLEMLKRSEDCFEKKSIFQTSLDSPLMDMKDLISPKTSREGKSKLDSGFTKKHAKEEDSTIFPEDIDINPSEFVLTNKVSKARIALVSTKGRDIGFKLKWDVSFLCVSPIQGIIPAKGELGLRVSLLPRRKYGDTVISVISNNTVTREIKITVKK